MSGTDKITEGISALAVNDTNGATADKQAATDAHSASIAQGRRLYIGNLAYPATEDHLKTFFSGFNM
jgi:RNA recognition motif-containing protein